MKKLFVILLMFLTVSSAWGKSNDTLRLHGTKYYLKYSAKSAENNGYINEYFKEGESPNIWSEMVAIHHFPNTYSPIDQAEGFRSYLDSMNCPSALSIDEEKNKGMIDFIIIDGKRLPIILEFNVFKYEKDKNCGTKAVQYAKRYCVTNTLQVEIVKREFNNSRKKILKRVDKFKIPELVQTDIKQDEIILDTNIKNEDSATEENILEPKSEDNTPAKEGIEATEEEVSNNKTINIDNTTVEPEDNIENNTTVEELQNINKESEEEKKDTSVEDSTCTKEESNNIEQ